jgi:serine/threonine-protein kinase
VVLFGVIGGGVFGYFALRKESFQVPVLIGLSEGEARNQIINNDWNLVVRDGRSDQVETGQIISTEPSDGVSLKEGETLVLVVSAGPTFSTLEDFANQTEAAAAARVSDLGLVPIVVKENDETVAEGTVKSWVVAEQPVAKVGDQVVKGTEITLNVSSGPAPRVVPTLVGLTPAEADAKIAELGLVVTLLEEDFNLEVAAGLLGGQLPAAGESLPRGGSVSYWISKGPRMVPMPKIVSEYKSTVLERLTTAGFKIGKVSGKDTRKLKAATINSEAVANGQEVPEGSTVDLTYYG